MRRGHIKTIEARFIGRGNIAVDKGRAWQVTCSQCPAKKVVGSAGPTSIPPAFIIKKLRQAGWFVGNKPKEDMCPVCYRRPIAVAAAKAKKVLAQMGAPMVTNGHGQAVHYSEVEAVALKLPREQAQQLIKALRETLPKTEPKAQKVQAPVETDDEYARWLEGLK